MVLEEITRLNLKKLTLTEEIPAGIKKGFKDIFTDFICCSFDKCLNEEVRLVHKKNKNAD